MKHRHIVAAIGIAAAAALTLAGCSGGSGGTAFSDTTPKELSGTVSFWHFFSDREADVIQSVVDDFEKKNPKVKVDVHSGQDDEKLQKAIATGSKVDVGLSYSTDIVGNFCSNGAFRSLNKVIERDGVDMSQFSDTVKSYTEFKGTRCAMPMLADVYGLYYNTDLLQAAGYTAPPKTLSELEAMADKLTTFNADGSIKTLGFNPTMGWYENSAAHYGPAAGAEWLKDDGTSAISSSPGWSELIQWQKAYVDKIGWDKLNAFTSGLGQEFSADNAFQTGQVAMNFDGEYRTAFIADQAKGLNYGTAPFPTADDHTDLYGGGYITGNIIGISKGSKQPELAWALLKYLTTDTDAVVKLANGLKNVPTTKDALTSPELEVSDQFKTFLDISSDKNVQTTPASPLGAGYQNSFQDFWNKYQSQGGDLQAGLKDVDKQIDDALALTTGP
ncbi:ABC transporter substrate-binding protein [Leifsonia aquatica]|uniref:ABC transporter, solute-binding protein n=2 Tax=Leifsonia aquatica TaxID=144185 RepID=U2T9A0_LEIAQ|nr:ABC transporter substrate-binding protein [Leifsonia aquatica]ERK71277.1 ABC transporter, solute-binding protein [Leifsonia aquatica ATCC 14665]MBB2965784.1 multiple sugar transport system substrate-binding protein [Leifsonia aquatica]